MNVNKAAALIERGQRVICFTTKSGVKWGLSEGDELTELQARRLMARLGLVPLNDGLFDGATQSYGLPERPVCEHA